MPSSDSGEADNNGGGSRKRKKNVDGWKHNKIKKARLQGQAYVSSKGKHVEAKTVGPPCK